MSLFLVNNLILLMTSGQFEYSEPALVSPPSMGSTLLRLILSLIIVIVLIFLLIKFFQRQMPFTRSGRWMRILDQVVIGQNRALILAEIAGKIYVLGITEHNITKLLEIDDPSKVALFSAEEMEEVILTPSGRGLWSSSVLVIDGGDRRARILGRGTNRVQGRKRVFFIMVILISAVFLLTCLPGPAEAQPISIPSLTLEVDSADNPEELTQSLQILLLITLLSLAPALLIMVTCFTRIIVVFSFLRNALATQPMPPNQVLIGLALFLTFFIMAPTWQEINQNALQPYIRGEITQDSAFERGMEPLRDFMFKQTRENDLALFVSFADIPQPETYDDIPNHVLIPAFIISELKTAFQIGFVLFIPFLVIDMVIASTLMSMGMLMLPPMMISLPFKILLFIMVDGWSLLVRSLILSYS